VADGQLQFPPPLPVQLPLQQFEALPWQETPFGKQHTLIGHVAMPVQSPFELHDEGHEADVPSQR
jgi:hypothetical protein